MCKMSIVCIVRLLFIFITRTQVGGRRGRDRMVVGFITTFAIRAYHH